MLAKGHHLPHVTLVVVVNADGGLYAADFRALEHSAQLLEQVAGRAGRAADQGRVLVQTLHPDDPHLGLLAEQGYGALARNLLEERRQAHLPPFTFMALLRIESPQETGGPCLSATGGPSAARVAENLRPYHLLPGPRACAHGATPKSLPHALDADRQ